MRSIFLLPLPFLATFLAGCLVAAPPEYAAESRLLQLTQNATSLERITHATTHEKNPSISKDGTLLAYELADAYDAPSRIEVLSIGKEDRSVVSGAVVEGWTPAWIDERHLVFAAHLADQDYARGVLVDLADLSAKPRTLFSPYVNVNVLWPTVFVAKSSFRIAAEISNDVIGTYTATRYDFHELRVFEPDGLGELNLGRGRYPAFSPDGRRIAFTGPGDRIVVADAKSGALLYYLMPGDMPAWSPDGELLAFCAPSGEGKDLYVVPYTGGTILRLTAGNAESCRPSWGANGWIYFHSNAEKSFDVWRLRLAGTSTM